MKRKVKIDGLIENDTIAIFGQDWVSIAMGLDKYENELAINTVDDPKDFELEVEMDDDDNNVILRVRHTYYVPIQMSLTLEHYITHITLNRITDPIYS